MARFCWVALSKVRPIVTKRKWTPHRDYTGEPMPPGVFRDPPDEPDRPTRTEWILGLTFLLAMAAIGVLLLVVGE